MLSRVQEYTVIKSTYLYYIRYSCSYFCRYSCSCHASRMPRPIKEREILERELYIEYLPLRSCTH